MRERHAKYAGGGQQRTLHNSSAVILLKLAAVRTLSAVRMRAAPRVRPYVQEAAGGCGASLKQLQIACRHLRRRACVSSCALPSATRTTHIRKRVSDELSHSCRRLGLQLEQRSAKLRHEALLLDEDQLAQLLQCALRRMRARSVP